MNIYREKAEGGPKPRTTYKTPWKTMKLSEWW